MGLRYTSAVLLWLPLAVPPAFKILDKYLKASGMKTIFVRLYSTLVAISGYLARDSSGACV